MTLHKIEIQNALVALAKAGTFYKVTYTDGVASIGAALSAGDIHAVANEISSSWTGNKRDGIMLSRVRSNWMFTLLLKFPVEVTLEAFEQSLANDIPTVTDADNKPLAKVALLSTVVTHPSQQGASNGTVATLTFGVVLSRI